MVLTFRIRNYRLLGLWVAATQRDIELSIWDNGEGIAPEFLPYLFDRFTQDATLSRPAGSGLGLYITKEIIERHKGEISVTSKQGKGTKFLISFKFETSSNSIWG